ncbi:uncharacterized protein [Ptychodera flava]|uniref:uncharacterized protein n=1 Tax=Ptychodera flava TaxID=63121 RepID=UPI003969F1DD
MFVTRTRVKMVVSVLQSRIPVLPTSVPALTVSKVSTVNKCLILVHQIRVPMAVHALRRDARHRDASALTAMKEITVFSWSTHATLSHVKMAASVLQCQAHAQNIHAHVPAAAGLVNSVKSRLMFVTRTRVKMAVCVLQSRVPVLPTSVPALTVSRFQL